MTPYRDNNSHVGHGAGFGVIWISELKAVNCSQTGSHYRRLFTSVQYFAASTGDLRSRLLSSDCLPNKDQSQLLHRGFFFFSHVALQLNKQELEEIMPIWMLADAIQRKVNMLLCTAENRAAWPNLFRKRRWFAVEWRREELVWLQRTWYIWCVFYHVKYTPYQYSVFRDSRRHLLGKYILARDCPVKAVTIEAVLQEQKWDSYMIIDSEMWWQVTPSHVLHGAGFSLIKTQKCLRGKFQTFCAVTF